MSSVDPSVVPDWFRAKFLAENPNDEHRVDEAWRSGNAGIASACPAPRSLREHVEALAAKFEKDAEPLTPGSFRSKVLDDVARELRAMLASLPGDDAQDARPELWPCAHNHKAKTSGCVSCELISRHSSLAQDAPPAPQGSDDSVVTLDCGCQMTPCWRCPVHGQP